MSTTSREYKGKSVIDFPDNYVVVDTETTGLDVSYDSIIELSALKIENQNIVDDFSTLVKPAPRYKYNNISGKFDRPEYVCAFITKLTGITNEMLLDAPEIKDVLPDFFRFIGNSVVVGHNVNFDINFLYEASMNVFNLPFTNDFIDTMRISRKLLPELKHHRLSDISEYFGLSYDGAHRALTDCMLTNTCFSSLKKLAYSKYKSIYDFKNEFKKTVKILKSKDITTDITEFDSSHPLYGKCCVFTGALEKLTRKDAMQLVVDLGGICGDSVTKKTNFLILGNNDYHANILKNGKSSKQKKAEQMILDNYDIQIISENVFYDMINFK